MSPKPEEIAASVALMRRWKFALRDQLSWLKETIWDLEDGVDCFDLSAAEVAKRIAFWQAVETGCRAEDA